MARPKTNLTIDEMMGVVSARNHGARVLSLATSTQPEMLRRHRVTGEPLDERYPLGVERRAVGRAILNFNYENNVNAQRYREEKPEDFVADPMWVSSAHPEGAARPDNNWPRFLVVHVENGKRYLRCRPKTTNTGRVLKEHDAYYDVETGRQIVGDELADLLENCLRRPGASRKQDLDRPIPVRTYEVKNVLAVCYAGRWYRVKN
jgi:hypothetical protein